MNVAEFRELVERTRHERTASREIARLYLSENGFIDSDGQLTQNYGGRDWCDEIGEERS